MPMNLKRDGTVRFYVYHTDEFAEIRYGDGNGQWRTDVAEKLKAIFRSRADGETFVLDKRLIELADHLQDHFGADTVEVISAYRSPEFNRHLKATGHNVANESFHTKGLAMDIHLDEVDEASVRDYLLALKLGGVGYYGNKLMVHMDFGPVRTWQDGGFVQNTGIGIFNKTSSMSLRTDKLFYRLSEPLKLTTSKNLTGELELQKFHRGKWLTAKTGLAVKSSFELTESFLKAEHEAGSVYGKYRLRYEKGGAWQNSNEFYVKR